MNFEIYEFLPLTRPKASLRRLGELLRTSHHAVLDLEDSAQDVLDPERTLTLKAAARHGLLQVAHSLGNRGRTDRLHIRVNEIDSPHHAADVEALAAWASHGLPLNVLLPKARSAEKTDMFRSGIARRCGQEPSIIPLLEDPIALKNAESVIRACRAERGRAIFGFFDHALESGVWPFPDPDSQEFWNLINEAARSIEATGAR